MISLRRFRASALPGPSSRRAACRPADSRPRWHRHRSGLTARLLDGPPDPPIAVPAGTATVPASPQTRYRAILLRVRERLATPRFERLSAHDGRRDPSVRAQLERGRTPASATVGSTTPCTRFAARSRGTGPQAWHEIPGTTPRRSPAHPHSGSTVRTPPHRRPCPPPPPPHQFRHSTPLAAFTRRSPLTILYTARSLNRIGTPPTTATLPGSIYHPTSWC